MYYEVSNKVYNHKLTEHEISHNNPFAKNTGRGKKKTRQTFFLVKDRPEKLFQFYKAGFCLKPHAFNFDNEQHPDCFVNSIVLDFDNLTKTQCDFVKANSKFGDYSSGMKTKLKEIEGIPNAPQPTVWKYKVFFPVEKCLCTYEDVDGKFLEAVKFYNPGRSEDEVKGIWTAWKRANNRKNNVNGVFQSKFNGWILPDVAMLNSYRTQITYGIDVNQSEKYKVYDDEWTYRNLPVAGMGKYATTDKYSYRGLDWKIEDGRPEHKKVEPDITAIEEDEKSLMKLIPFQYDTFNLPLSKAKMCGLLKQNHIADVVLGGSSLKYMLAKVFGRQLDLSFNFDELMRDAALVGKSMARVLCETRKQGLTMFIRHHALEDCVKAFKEIHGQNIFTQLKKYNKLEEVIHQIARSFEVAGKKFPIWRQEQRLALTTPSPEVMEARNKWRDTGLEEDMIEFFRIRNADILKRWEEAKSPIYNSPYDYHKRGVKQNLFRTLMDGEIKIESPTAFVERMRLDIIPQEDGQFSDDLLKKWYVQYKTLWNKTYPENTIGRKSRRGKWAEMFNGKTTEEVQVIIKTLDISKQMKQDLMKRYVKNTDKGILW